MLEIRPSCALVVDGRLRTEIVDEDASEGKIVIALDVAIACEREHSGSPATATTVIPKAWSRSFGQTRSDHRLPTAVGELHPLEVSGERGKESKDLGVTGRSVTPPVAVALDQLRSMLRI
jgi:hypothetical protein